MDYGEPGTDVHARTVAGARRAQLCHASPWEIRLSRTHTSLFVAALLLSCGGDTTAPAPVTLSVNPPTALLVSAGSTILFNAHVTGIAGREVEWSSYLADEITELVPGTTHLSSATGTRLLPAALSEEDEGAGARDA